MLDVPDGLNQRHQLEVYSQLQYRRARPADASSRDLLFDLCYFAQV